MARIARGVHAIASGSSRTKDQAVSSAAPTSIPLRLSTTELASLPYFLTRVVPNAATSGLSSRSHA